MKKIFIVALLLAGVTEVKSQQFSIETGTTISSFKYKNSLGNSLENLQATEHSYMSIGYRKSVFTKNLFLNLGSNYSSFGSIGSDRVLNNYFEWDMSYLGAGLGFDYEVYKPGNFTLYIKGTASAEFLIHGTQTLNGQVYKLSGVEDFDTPLYFLRGGLGMKYDISDKLAVFTQYLYGVSGTLKNIPGSLNINAHSVGFGILISLSKNTSPSKEVDNVQILELKKELEINTQKVKEMEVKAQQQVEVLKEEIVAKEEKIVAKDEEIRSLKESITSALLSFNGKGLTIKERDGKVYVTMENDMLFKSGSWEVGPDGEKAVNALGSVLAENPDVTILIEGHTDNQPFKGTGNISNNWDLSSKRATAIVEILRTNKDINPKNLTAAGRGEYDPIADNATTEGKAKNRRIEIILTPKLDEVLKLIKK